MLTFEWTAGARVSPRRPNSDNNYILSGPTCTVFSTRVDQHTNGHRRSNMLHTDKNAARYADEIKTEILLSDEFGVRRWKSIGVGNHICIRIDYRRYPRTATSTVLLLSINVF